MVRWERALARGVAAFVLVGVVVARAALAGAGAQQPTRTRALVFDRVTVVDVEHGKLLSEQRVVVVGNRIAAVGTQPAVPMPKDAQVVDAKGKYMIPGLWDMHTHQYVNPYGGLVVFPDVEYRLHVAHGVTGMRNASAEVSLDTLHQWRQEILAGTRVGPPRQILSARIDEHGGAQRFRCQQRHSEIVCMASGDSAGARRLVDSVKAAGADMLKTYQLSRPMYFVLAREARRAGLRIGGHVNARMEVTAAEAADSGVGIIDHLSTSAGGLDTLCFGKRASLARCQPVAERFQRTNTWSVPTTLDYAGNIFGPVANPTTPGERLQKVVAEHKASFFAGAPLIGGNWLRAAAPLDAHPPAATESRGLLRIAYLAGLPLLASSHGRAGFELHQELAVMVAEGLTPVAALQAATLNPVKFLRGTDSLGTVAPGKLADLVLLDADPLADITNITTVRAVVANGRYFDRPVLDGLLAEAAQLRRKAQLQSTTTP